MGNSKCFRARVRPGREHHTVRPGDGAVHEAELVVLEVLPASRVLAKTAAKERQKAEEHPMRAEQGLLDRCAKARHATRHGADEAAEIVGCAAVSDVDLIAMSTHGRSGVGRWVVAVSLRKLCAGRTSLPCSAGLPEVRCWEVGPWKG